MQNNFLLQKIQQIAETHTAKLKKQISEGRVKAIAMGWRNLVTEKYEIPTPMFTAKERGQVKDLCVRYNPQDLQDFMSWAIEKWTSLTRAGDPPTPVFSFFYARRDSFYSKYFVYRKVTKEQERAIDPDVAWQKTLQELKELGIDVS